MTESEELVPPEDAASYLSERLDRLGIKDQSARNLAVFETLLSEVLHPKESEGLTTEQAIAALFDTNPDLAAPLLTVGKILKVKMGESPQTETGEAVEKFLKSPQAPQPEKAARKTLGGSKAQ